MLSQKCFATFSNTPKILLSLAAAWIIKCKQHNVPKYILWIMSDILMYTLTCINIYAKAHAHLVNWFPLAPNNSLMFEP